jgi:hypothetical protein
MEMLDTVHPNMNHVQPTVPPNPTPPPAFDLDALMEKREQLIQGLNGARAQLETQAQSVARTEGALMMVNQLIQELDPTALAQREPSGSGG